MHIQKYPLEEFIDVVLKGYGNMYDVQYYVQAFACNNAYDAMHYVLLQLNMELSEETL